MSTFMTSTTTISEKSITISNQSLTLFSFDRILSIEVSHTSNHRLISLWGHLKMFEHMKNYKALLCKISTWLRPTKERSDDPALLFVHIFCHKSMPYHFDQDDGWMAQNFFSGRLCSMIHGLFDL